MKLQETHDFDYDAATVLRVLTDADYYRRKYDTLGGEARIGATRDDGDTFAVEIRHALDLSETKLPDVVRSRLGSRIRLDQNERWTRSSRTGACDIEVEGAPASARLDMRVDDHASGSRVTLDLEIKVSIPLIGGRVEKSIAPPLVRHMHRDLALTNDIAADYAP